jgi:hypothetical protein
MTSEASSLSVPLILEQRFSNCGTRTTSGTRKTIRWYAEGRDRTEIKNLIFNSYINLKTQIHFY